MRLFIVHALSSAKLKELDLGHLSDCALLFTFSNEIGWHGINRMQGTSAVSMQFYAI